MNDARKNSAAQYCVVVWSIRRSSRSFEVEIICLRFNQYVPILQKVDYQFSSS